jgi:hypothetical protein
MRRLVMRFLLAFALALVIMTAAAVTVVGWPS